MTHEDNQTMGPPDEHACDFVVGPGAHLILDPPVYNRVQQVEKGISLILTAMGVDLKDRNFEGTPHRYAKFLEELFWGPKPSITSFPEVHDQMVIIRDHEAWTLCPHHLLPVRLSISVGYIPRGSVLGLSKLGRLFDEINTQPLMQETAVDLLCQKIFLSTGEMGAGVIMKGEHLCMRMRGIKSARCEAITSKLMGAMRENPQARAEFLALAAPH